MRGLVLFDIDGTLLKPGDLEHQAAFVHALQEVYGHPATLDGVPLAGMLDSQIARISLTRHGLTPAEIDAGLAEMVALMGERYAMKVARDSRIERLLPGVVEAIERLESEQFALGVLTGNVRAVAYAKLAAAGIDRFFAVGAFGDTAHERSHLVHDAWQEAERHFKQAFSPEQTVLIGDTPRDIEAAHANNARVLAVATGRFSVADLKEHQPEAVVPDLSDTSAVLAAVDRMISS